MATGIKRRGRLVIEQGITQRPKTGKHHGIDWKKVKGTPKPVTVHRRSFYRGKLSILPKDPREEYAVPKTVFNGTLPERILYKALLDRHLVPGVDFDAQSSLAGGRMNLGGQVADYLFPYAMTIIQVQGDYWHGHFDQITGNLISGDITQGRKDQTSWALLNQMGYTVWDLWESTAYNPRDLEQFLEMVVDPLLVGKG